MMSRPLEQVLSGMLKSAAPAAPRAGWEQRAMEAIAHGAPRGRTWRRVAWWRLAPVAIVIAMLLPAALWWLPRRGGFALTRVARATANVRSAHFVGWELDRSGAREPKEVWVEPRRMRISEGGASEYYDESRYVMIQTVDGRVHADIDSLPDDMAKLLGETGGYLRRLLWPQAAQEVLETRDETAVSWERQRLDDGRSVIVADLAAGGRTTRMTVDERTDLVMWVEGYENGELVAQIGPFEYNVDIPEEVFHYSIPEGATVVDNTAEPASLLAQGMEPPGEEMLLSIPAGSNGGSCGSWFHKHLRIEYFGPGVAAISYVPQRNSYRVVGKARFIGYGLDVTVEDREYIFPRPPDTTFEQYQAEEARRNAEEARRMPPPEVERWREAKGKELAAAGAESYGMCGGKLVIGGYSFDVLNDRMIEVWYLRSKNEFYVMGKAHVYGHGTDQVVEDGRVKVTGPPPSPLERGE